MPVITFEGTSLKKEQKKELVSAFTKAAAEITSTPPQFFSVVIREQPEENPGFAGETMEELKNGSGERLRRNGMNAIFTRRSVRTYQDRQVEAETTCCCARPCRPLQPATNSRGRLLWCRTEKDSKNSPP